MRRQDHSASYRIYKAIEVSPEAYTVILPAIALLAVYTHAADQHIAKPLSLVAFYAVSITIAITLVLIDLLNYVSVEVVCENTAGVTEDLSLPMSIYLRPMGIARLVLVEEVSLESDAGLWIARWVFTKPSSRLEVEVSGYPGLHKIRGLHLVLKPATRLARVRLRVAIEKPIEICIIPKRAGRRFNVDVVLPRLLLLEGKASRRKGAGSEVMGVREFNPSDEYKKIHWKATARTGRLMVREYEQRMFRNAVVIVSVHYGFFLGRPPPIVFLSRIVADIAETLASIGLRISLGLVTEKDIKIVGPVDRHRVYEVYRALSEIEWPDDVGYIRYTSSNKILRWFSRAVVEKVCRDPSIVVLAVDPLDSVDVDSVIEVSKSLRKQNHIVKILLTVPTTLRFLHAPEVGLSDVADVESEISKTKRVLARLGHRDVYIPTAYLKT